MGRSSTTFQPGKSGNPKGRPPKKRALTNLLERGGNAKLGADETAAKRLFTARVWEGLATGQMTFAEGRVLQLEPSDFVSLAKLVLAQVDGPPRQDIDLTTMGETINTSVSVDNLKSVFQMMGAREKDAPGDG